MTSSIILSVVTFIYGLAGFLYIFAWIFKKTLPARLATWVVILGVGGNTAGIVLRWVESYQLGFGHAPLSNLYESLVFFAWTISVIYLYIERRYENQTIGAFAAPLAFLALAYASLSPNISDRIQPLLPALKSNWLIAHVISCFIGYAAFAIACGISIMYILKQRDAGAAGSLLDRLPSSGVLDELTHQLVMFGFLFLTAGIITETWSLITWFVYAILLHARMMRGWRGKRIAVISIVGFAAVMFTYFGVNYLPGLHSYGSV